MLLDVRIIFRIIKLKNAISCLHCDIACQIRSGMFLHEGISPTNSQISCFILKRTPSDHLGSWRMLVLRSTRDIECDIVSCLRVYRLYQPNQHFNVFYVGAFSPHSVWNWLPELWSDKKLTGNVLGIFRRGSTPREFSGRHERGNVSRQANAKLADS